MLILALLLWQTDPRYGPMNDRLEEFCYQEARCIARERSALKQFMGIMVMYDAPQTTAQNCMRAATAPRKGKRLTNWTMATTCLRNWSKGRPSVVKRGLNRPS